ncbi:MAG: hypothetical protein F6K55_38870 [Moorea sp. SIO4A3]|nr:hypothetical protein [Moorena sp. SIO4A3]
MPCHYYALKLLADSLPWLLALGSYLLPLTLVVRYGADYLNPGYKVEDEGKSAPNAPYALFPIPYCLLPTAM